MRTSKRWTTHPTHSICPPSPPPPPALLCVQELASDPNIYERLMASVAPSIWQLDDVKRGILCQLFGGVSKALPGARTRGEINVLLVGDPGVSKSQILR